MYKGFNLAETVMGSKPDYRGSRAVGRREMLQKLRREGEKTNRVIVRKG